ncbi:MAG: 4-hydroxy-tetrahydrodipicolinate reductase [Oscillospiraceae bacterium]|nr:4-hydroxy-tetrahydrodipicolinate reductase [Oscillospiraceae bacterium]
MKLIIHGAAGRMGRALVRALENNGDFQLLYAVDPVLPVRALSQCRQKADCVIDFSHHSATKALLDYCLRTKTPVVVCTTGHTQAEHALLCRAAGQIPVFHSSNVSLGIALLTQLVSQTAQRFPDADITIIETHHSQKRDAPSGTALLLSQAIPSPRNISIHSVRRGTVAGIHRVIFTTESQTVTLQHEAHHRGLYAQGALTAAAWLTGQRPGLYSMKDLVV